MNTTLGVCPYTILIYKEGDSVCAEVSIDGQTTMAHAKAKIYGSDSWISLVFDEYYPDEKLEKIYSNAKQIY